MSNAISFSDKSFKERTMLHQEFVSPYGMCEYKWYCNCQLGRRTHDMRIKVIGDGHIDGLFTFCHKWCRDFGNGVCPDASL